MTKKFQEDDIVIHIIVILFILIAPAQETKSVIAIFDFFLCIFFIGDFIYRLQPTCQ